MLVVLIPSWAYDSCSFFNIHFSWKWDFWSQTSVNFFFLILETLNLSIHFDCNASVTTNIWNGPNECHTIHPCDASKQPSFRTKFSTLTFCSFKLNSNTAANISFTFTLTNRNALQPYISDNASYVISSNIIIYRKVIVSLKVAQTHNLWIIYVKWVYACQGHVIKEPHTTSK